MRFSPSAYRVRLAAAPEPARRWVGKDALRDLNRPLVRKRLGL